MRHGDRADSRIAAISIAEDQTAVTELAELHKLPWPVILDPPVDGHSRVFDRYRVPGIPSLWVIDKTGKVVAMNTYYSDLPAIIEPLLK